MPKLAKPLKRKTNITFRRTKKPLKRRIRGSTPGTNIANITLEQKKRAAYEMRLEYAAFADIGDALGVDESTARRYCLDVANDVKTEIEELAPHVLQMELDRIDRQILYWYKQSKHDIKASELVLHWSTQKHKLLGLGNTSKLEMSGRGGGPIQVSASNIDITKLSDKQLAQLEEIIRVAGPEVPEDRSVLEHKPKKKSKHFEETE